MKAKKTLVVVIFIILLGLIIRICLPTIMFFYVFLTGGPFSSDTILNKLTSPNQEYRLVEYEHDAGATGGDVYIYVERIKFNNNKTRFKRDLYWGDWGKRPSIKWIDSEHVKINEREINIFKSAIIEDYPN